VAAQGRRGSLRRTFGRADSAAGGLEAEIAAGTKWIYPWQLRDGRRLTVVGDSIIPVHQTRSRLIEPAVRAALEAAGPGATALDLACNEGWFSHRLLEWGAAKVVGIDVREPNVQRATMLRDHYGITPEQFEVRQEDIFALDPAELGQFDVVLLLGLIYHVEDPTGAIRIARGCTRGVCAIETQLTRQRAPIEFGNGIPGLYDEAEGSFAVLVEEGDHVMTSLASTGGVLSLIPNRAALLDMLRVAGFSEWSFPETEAGDEVQYVEGDRTVALARP
jgi:tRNA (mo5U34)-methyltransferase